MQCCLPPHPVQASTAFKPAANRAVRTAALPRASAQPEGEQADAAAPQPPALISTRRQMLVFTGAAAVTGSAGQAARAEEGVRKGA